MWMHTTGAGHVMRRDTGHVHDEMSGISPGLGRRRDGFRTKHGMSHNSPTSCYVTECVQSLMFLSLIKLTHVSSATVQCVATDGNGYL